MAMGRKQNCYFPLSLSGQFAITPAAAKCLKTKLLRSRDLSADNFNKGLDICEQLNIKKIDLITAQCVRNFNNFTHNFSHKTEMPTVKSSEEFVLSQLYRIIPNIYFGSPRNRTRFNKIVRRILSQSCGECVHLSLLFEDFQLDCIPWLVSHSESVKPQQLMITNILLMQIIVKPLINYCWYFEKDIRTFEARLVPRRQLDSFCDQNFNVATKRGLLETVNDLKGKELLGKLLFIKKGPKDLGYRPVLWRNFKGRKDNYLKKKLGAIIRTFQIGDERDLFKKWAAFVEVNGHKKSYGGRNITFYGVKLDLLDAFGLVELDKLKEMIAAIDPKMLTMNDKNKLNSIIDEQYVLVRGKNRDWKKGLLQGAPLSPLLCELYLSHTYYHSFKHFNQPHAFMHRNMDDIFFVSTKKTEVYKFESTANKVWILNERKTHQYTVPDIDDPIIIFCGKIFNLISLQTSSAFEGRNGETVNVRNKFKIWNVGKQYNKEEALEFFNDFMSFCALNFYFSGFEVNTKYNLIDTVVKNIFDGMIFAAFKMFSAVESINYLFKKQEDIALIFVAIRNVVNQYSLKIYQFIMRNKGHYYHDFLTVKVIKFICFKAFIVVFKKSSKYWSVVNSAKSEIKRELKVSKLPLVVDIKYFGLLPKCFQNYSTKRTSIFKNMLESKK